MLTQGYLYYVGVSDCPSYTFSFFKQGVDIRHNKDRKVHRKEPKSQDIYLRLLVKVRNSVILSVKLFVLYPLKLLHQSNIMLGVCSCTGSWHVAPMLPSTRLS